MTVSLQKRESWTQTHIQRDHHMKLKPETIEHQTTRMIGDHTHTHTGRGGDMEYVPP
jgi:hypothetical protein